MSGDENYRFTRRDTEAPVNAIANRLPSLQIEKAFGETIPCTFVQEVPTVLKNLGRSQNLTFQQNRPKAEIRLTVLDDGNRPEPDLRDGGRQRSRKPADDDLARHLRRDYSKTEFSGKRRSNAKYKTSWGSWMVNLGIVVAVDDYGGELGSLPGCRQDGNAMTQILRSEPRFDELLIIDSDTNSESVKRRLIEFIERFRNQEVGEIVFYFSGHGDYINDVFYYLLTGYQGTRRKSISLQNSELDSFVRSPQPELFVKIVDACHSGNNYIKRLDDFKDYLGEGQAGFKMLYFMFSSRADQSSYQDRHLSDFTGSIIKSIFVSDEFETFGYQTPIFVTQADFTDIFCETSLSLNDSLKDYLPDEALITPKEGGPSKRMSIVELIRHEAAMFCSEAEAVAVIRSIRSRLGAPSLSEDLSEPPSSWKSGLLRAWEVDALFD